MLTVSSPAFSPGGDIPERHTCDAEGVSPPLQWTGAPPGTRSFVLIVHDPDVPDPAAPRRQWVHWVLYNLPSSILYLEEAVVVSTLGDRVYVGLNDSHERGYDPPCPPIGSHRYIHTVFALDCELPDLGPSARRSDVENAMEGHVLAEAGLVGTYQRASERPTQP